MSETKPAIFIPGETGEVSDGYHTFNELYEHRHALFIALATVMPASAWRSREDVDGKGMPGWFLAGINLSSGTITYHLPDRLWPLLNDVATLQRAPKWDGHTSADVVNRLYQWAKPVEAGEGPDLLQLVMEGMGWPKEKAQRWFNTPNPLLGGAIPNGYGLLKGKGRLEKFIRQQLKENEPVEGGGE